MRYRKTTPIGGALPRKKAPQVVKPQPPLVTFTLAAWARTGVARGWLEATGWLIDLDRAVRGRAEIPAPGATKAGVPGHYDLGDLCDELGQDPADVVRQIRQWAASKGARWEGDDDPRCPAITIERIQSRSSGKAAAR